MLRYWLFSGDIYYPVGGMEDFKGSFETIYEAKTAHADGSDYGQDWAHIYDLEAEKVILEKIKGFDWREAKD